MASATRSDVDLVLQVDTTIGAAAASDIKLDEAAVLAAISAREAAEVSTAGLATWCCGLHSH
jgi:hypothetical protein